MSQYIDGFAFPIAKDRVADYQPIAEAIAAVWKEHGALAYHEYVGDDVSLEGTRSFVDLTSALPDEKIVFGWVVFPSKEIRDQANTSVPKDPRMERIVGPLIDPDRLVFDAGRMVFGGFKPFIQTEK